MSNPFDPDSEVRISFDADYEEDLGSDYHVVSVAGVPVIVPPYATIESVEDAPPPAPTAHAGQTRSFWVHWNSVLRQGSAEAAAVFDREAPRRDYVLLNTWDHWMIPELKRRNPNIKCFVYKDLSSTRSYDNGPIDLQPCGVRYVDAHPDWFLKDASGNRIQYSGYPGHWLMDVGHPNYMVAWVTNVINSVSKYGFDGVFMDNALWTRTAYGTPPAKYATDATFQAAYRAMLSYSKGRFGPLGITTIANLSNARLVNGRWESYMQHLDGGWDEWWLTISDNDLLSEYDAGWSRVIGEIEKNEAANKITLVQPHFAATGSSKAFRYAHASYLIANGFKAAISEIQERDGYGLPSPWHPEYDYDLGVPLEPRQLVYTNIWRRRFQNGVVVVNCNRTGSASMTVPLGGTYSTVSAVTLAGTSGIVLKK